MARDDEHWRRRREREEEEAAAEAAALSKGAGSTNSQIIYGGKADLGEKIDELIRRAEPMFEQLNSLYNQFATGVELRPPLERRGQLDQLMSSLLMVGKPNATYMFKARSMLTTYNSLKEKWDKLVKDVESGKIKRTAGPKRGPGGPQRF